MITEELIINFTPTGMLPTKNMTQYVPVGVQEIIEDVHQAVEIGISMVHIHARDEKTGEPTYKKEVYAEIIEEIRKFAPRLVICVSLSGRTFKDYEQRVDPLLLESDLKPDMGSLTLSSLNFNKIESVNSPDMIWRLAEEMSKRNIMHELEAFDAGMINYAKYLERKGMLQAPHYFNLLLGNIACAQADMLHAGVMINDLPDKSYWSLAGVGDGQLKMNGLAIAFGGGVRVGLEDNIWYDRNRSRLANNSDLLKRIHRLAEANERRIMQPEHLRKLLLLEDGDGKYGRKCQVGKIKTSDNEDF